MGNGHMGGMDLGCGLQRYLHGAVGRPRSSAAGMPRERLYIVDAIDDDDEDVEHSLPPPSRAGPACSAAATPQQNIYVRDNNLLGSRDIPRGMVYGKVRTGKIDALTLSTNMPRTCPNIHTSFALKRLAQKTSTSPADGFTRALPHDDDSHAI